MSIRIESLYGKSFTINRGYIKSDELIEQLSQFIIGDMLLIKDGEILKDDQLLGVGDEIGLITKHSCIDAKALPLETIHLYLKNHDIPMQLIEKNITTTEGLWKNIIILIGQNTQRKKDLTEKANLERKKETENKIKTMTEMGFTEIESKQALEINYENVGMAVNYLVEKLQPSMQIFHQANETTSHASNLSEATSIINKLLEHFQMQFPETTNQLISHESKKKVELLKTKYIGICLPKRPEKMSFGGFGMGGFGMDMHSMGMHGKGGFEMNMHKKPYKDDDMMNVPKDYDLGLNKVKSEYGKYEEEKKMITSDFKLTSEQNKYQFSSTKKENKFIEENPDAKSLIDIGYDHMLVMREYKNKGNDFISTAKALYEVFNAKYCFKVNQEDAQAVAKEFNVDEKEATECLKIYGSIEHVKTVLKAKATATLPTAAKL